MVNEIMTEYDEIDVNNETDHNWPHPGLEQRGVYALPLKATTTASGGVQYYQALQCAVFRR